MTSFSMELLNQTQDECTKYILETVSMLFSPFL